MSDTTCFGSKKPCPWHGTADCGPEDHKHPFVEYLSQPDGWDLVDLKQRPEPVRLPAEFDQSHLMLGWSLWMLSMVGAFAIGYWLGAIHS